MKFALAKEHHDFFDKNGFIEFDGLLSAPSIEKLSKAIRQEIGIRSNHLPERLSLLPAPQLFSHGRDLWRSQPEIRKQVVNQNLATIASGLIRQKPIRIALDQWIPAGVELKNMSTIEQIVPVQGVIAAAFIALDSGIVSEETPSFFPTTAGNVLFVKPNIEIPFEELNASRSQNFLLVVYGSRNSVYIHNQSDSLTHYLKEMDYVYGDRLSDSTHPLFLQ